MFKSLSSASAFGFFALASLTFHEKQKKINSLGLIGYIGREPKAFQVILEGLENIQNNDFDSLGLATLHGTEARITKYQNRGENPAISKLKSEAFQVHSSSTVGIAHTHISSKGCLSETRAHPQPDHNNRAYIAYNGSITNLSELLTFINTRGITPKTDSNAEILATLIGLFLEDGLSLKVATRLALEKTKGTLAVVAVDKQNPDQLVVAQKGADLYMSLNNGEIIVSSDEKVLKGKVLKLEDSAVYNLDARNKRVESVKVKDLPSLVSLGDSPHWTLKEIEEQPQVIARAMNYGARLATDSAKLKGLEEIKETFLKVKNLVLVGCGNSFHACQFGSHIMKQLRLMDTVTIADPSSSSVIFPQKNAGAILISESGETEEIIKAGQTCKLSKIPVISIVNEASSTLAKLTSHGVFMNAGKEIAEAGTKSFVASCVVLIEVALYLSKIEHPEMSEFRQRIVSSLLALPMITGSVIAKNKDETRSLAEELKNEEHIFVLGRGMGESIACEGASLLKQLALVHAEGYAGGALKHGPFALISDGRPIILIILDDEHKEMMNLALAEVQARNAKTIVITPDRALITTKEPPSRVLLIEENGPLTGLLAVVPLQLLAYNLGVRRGIDPDFPVNSESFMSIA